MLANWQGIADIINECGGNATRKIPASEIETLVEFHGWEVIGLLMKTYNDEKNLQNLVKLGIPFEEAIKFGEFKHAN